ncbi:MAG: YgiQ family radical SAM protein [Eubacteriales bacterium]|nr:YgiQ family radical SAM protein [Eubacteriales bacterium]
MFLPISSEDMIVRGWDKPDFVIVTGDAYVDHPSFGTAIISRVLEAEGYRVCIIAQPDWKNTDDFKRFGRPRLGFLINSGNVDSMVAHYTAAKKPRSTDYYSPGGKAGLRPDRAVIVYCNRVREAYGDVAIIIGGIEVSTRRFTHYDYWSDRVRRSILIDSGADLISYGMGENSLRRIAFLLDKGVPVKKLRDIRGTCFMTTDKNDIHYDFVETGSYDKLKTDKKSFAEAFALQYENQDPIYGKALIEDYGGKYVVQNPPMLPLTRKELDAVYSLPYERNWHPVYAKDGGVPAIDEVKFSITHCRGCFGACNFCSIAFHQGRMVTSRSIKSVKEEAEIIAAMPDFKGYIHDIGGPTANFRHPSCEKQKEAGVCKNRRCLFPTPCPNLNTDHSEYIKLLEEVEKVEGVKKVFIRSGIRFDYMMCDKNEKFFRRLVDKHVSGQLKVAPEHICDSVLIQMGKPGRDVYDKFMSKFYRITKETGKEQYLVPYLMSSHPGSSLNEAIELALYLKINNINPEQVQDFYPTPGTASTCMYYTGTDPFTGIEVYVAKTYGEKQAQRALLQFYRKENYPLIRKTLLSAGRGDLIGYGNGCLVPPAGTVKAYRDNNKAQKTDKTDKSVIKKLKSYKKYNGTKRK